MKTLTILVPTYNEEENIDLVYERVVSVMEKELPSLQFEILFIDNHSEDRSRELIRALCEKDSRVKAIFNIKNFGYARSPFYGILQAEGDAVMMLHADMQNPPELIPEFVAKWEKGAKVVIGVKTKSKENPIMYAARSIYYKLMHAMSEVEQVEQFTDYELLDRDFIEILKQVEDPVPYLRGLVNEFGYKVDKVYYVQDKRRHGKSHASLLFLYDYAMLGITAYSKILLRAATFVGGGVAVVCLLMGVITVIKKLINWNTFSIGMAAALTGVFFLGAIELVFIGILGEYVLNINSKTIKRPLVVEEERINFHGKKNGSNKKEEGSDVT